MSTRKKSTIWHKILLSLTVFSFCIQAFVMLAEYWWIFELFSHYIAYYAVLGGILLILQLCSRRFIMALILTPIIAIQFAALSPYLDGPFNFETETNYALPYTEELSILASNVFRKTQSFEDLEQVITQEDPDIFVIHEANELWEEEILKYEEIYPYSYRNSPGVKGMVIASKNPGVFFEYSLGGVPILEYRATNEEGELLYRVIAVHPPPPMHKSYAEERNAHLQALSTYLNPQFDESFELEEAETSNLPTIVIGDFNITPWSPHFQNLLNTTNYKDARVGFGLQNTWHAHWPFPKIPIDHALVSPDIHVLDFYTTEKIQSDHLPIVVEIEI